MGAFGASAVPSAGQPWNGRGNHESDVRRSARHCGHDDCYRSGVGRPAQSKEARTRPGQDRIDVDSLLGSVQTRGTPWGPTSDLDALKSIRGLSVCGATDGTE